MLELSYEDWVRHIKTGAESRNYVAEKSEELATNERCEVLFRNKYSHSPCSLKEPII